MGVADEDRWVPHLTVSSPLPAPAAVVRVAVAVVALLGFAAVLALPAAAEPSLVVREEITDRAGVLTGREAEVQDALDQLSDQTPLQLFVVFVDDFAGSAPEDWADTTAIDSGLGVDDLLLAVAVEDRMYYLSADPDVAVYDRLGTVTAAVESQLRAEDWAGAAITGAQTLIEVATGATQPGVDVTDPQDPAGAPARGGGGGLLVLLVVGVVVIGGVLAARSLSRKPSGGQAAGAAQGEPTPVLRQRAGSALVAVDDVLRSADQELGFAQAQFGADVTAEFEQTLVWAREQVTEAFHLNQELEDSTPEPQVREHSSRILQVCEQVTGRLQEQTARFDELRDLQARAPEALDQLQERARSLDGRVEQARVVLEQLQRRYPAGSLASVGQNPDQVRALLEEVHAGVGQGREALGREDRGTAVAYARAAESALDQCTTLLDAVDRAGPALAEAGQRLDAA
ncbi:methanol dehydrogenase, partial [Cellulomonas bogoriensis 69B4 = DSM 16987]